MRFRADFDRPWNKPEGGDVSFFAAYGVNPPSSKIRFNDRHLFVDWRVPMKPDRLLLIADFIPPGPEALERFDAGDQVKRIIDLGFNAQHIEVTDVTVGEAGVAFFRSKHARLCRRDLLKEYREHHGRRGTLDIIYFNVHWLSGELIPLHPEWFQRDHHKKILPIPYGSGGYSCINSPFRDWAIKMIEEIAQCGVKGIFLDGPVFNPGGCYCDACAAGFKQRYGLSYPSEPKKNPLVLDKVLTFKRESIARFVRDVRKSLKRVHPDAVLYMNGLPLGPGTCGRDNRLAEPWQDALLAEGGFLSGDLRSIPIWKPAAGIKWFKPLIRSSVDEPRRCRFRRFIAEDGNRSFSGSGVFDCGRGLEHRRYEPWDKVKTFGPGGTTD